jgi:hypothetical protein
LVLFRRPTAQIVACHEDDAVRVCALDHAFLDVGRDDAREERQDI